MYCYKLRNLFLFFHLQPNLVKLSLNLLNILSILLVLQIYGAFEILNHIISNLRHKRESPKDITDLFKVTNGLLLLFKRQFLLLFGILRLLLVFSIHLALHELLFELKEVLLDLLDYDGFSFWLSRFLDDCVRLYGGYNFSLLLYSFARKAHLSLVGWVIEGHWLNHDFMVSVESIQRQALITRAIHLLCQTVFETTKVISILLSGSLVSSYSSLSLSRFWLRVLLKIFVVVAWTVVQSRDFLSCISTLFAMFSRVRFGCKLTLEPFSSQLIVLTLHRQMISCHLRHSRWVEVSAVKVLFSLNRRYHLCSAIRFIKSCVITRHGCLVIIKFPVVLNLIKFRSIGVFLVIIYRYCRGLVAHLHLKMKRLLILIFEKVMSGVCWLFEKTLTGVKTDITVPWILEFSSRFGPLMITTFIIYHHMLLVETQRWVRLFHHQPRVHELAAPTVSLAPNLGNVTSMALWLVLTFQLLSNIELSLIWV